MPLRTGHELDLYRFNPLRYADEQRIERCAEAIDLFLHGVSNTRYHWRRRFCRVSA